MKKISLISKILFIIAVVFINCGIICAQGVNIQYQLDSISEIDDSSIKQEIKNNILLNCYSDNEEFNDVLDSSSDMLESRFDITGPAEEIYKLDDGKMDNVTITEHRGKSLFSPIDETKIPESYKWTLELCNKFNPAKNTNDHKRLKKDIDEYLDKIQDLPVIKHALKVTGTSIEDFRKNWFGEGRGFEHIIAGETSGSTVSGYHWWYKFYDDEKKGQVVYQSSLEALNDENIFTGKFTWDPEGSVKKCSKKKGGFIIGESAAALLALGHIAMEASKNNGIRTLRSKFWANINGTSYLWCMYTQNGTIRTLYPTASQSYIFSIDD